MATVSLLDVNLLVALFDSDLRGHGCRLPQDEVARLLELDVELDAQGLAVWLDRG